MTLPDHWATDVFLTHAHLELLRPVEGLAWLKRLVLQHFPHSTFVQGLQAKCHYNCRSACTRVAVW